MKVKDILDNLKRPTITIAGDKTIQDAMKLMVDHKIGSVVVVNAGGDPAGILTERDIFRLCHHCKAAMMTMKIADHMTTDLAVGLPEDDLNYIARVITQSAFGTSRLSTRPANSAVSSRSVTSSRRS